MTSYRVLIVTLGILPLGILASMNLMGALRAEPAGPQPLIPGQDLQVPAGVPLDLKHVADGAVKAATDARPVIDKLEKFDLFGRELLDEAQSLPKSPLFSGVTESWGLLQQAQKLTVEVGNNLKRFSKPKTAKSKPVRRTEAEVTEEIEVVEKLLAEKFQGDTPLLKMQSVQAIQRALEGQVEDLTRSKDLAKTLKELHKSYADGKFEECLNKIANDIPRTGLSPEEVAEVQEIEGHAKFWTHWKSPPAASESPANLVKKLVLLIHSPDAPKPNGAKEEEFLKSQEQRLASAKSTVKINEFFQTPPNDLTELVKGCEEIFEQDPSSKQRLGSEIKKNLKSKLPDKKPSLLSEGIQEVKLKDGTGYLRGFFKPLGGTRPAYQYWESKKLSTEKPSGYTTKHLEDFYGPPGPPQDVIAAKAYSDKRLELSKNPEVQQKWIDFEISCAAWQKQVAEYYSVQKVDNPLRFDEEGQLAHEVLELWPRMAPFLMN